MRVWPVHFNRLDRTAVLRLAAPACGSFGAGLRSADGPQSLAGAQAKTGGSVQDQDARRVVRHHGGYRYLLCADPDHARGAASSAYGGARDFCHPPRRHPARPGTPFFADTLGDPRCSQGGYHRVDQRMEERRGNGLSSPDAAQRAALAAWGAADPWFTSWVPSLWCIARALHRVRDTIDPTPRPSTSARRGESDLPRSIRTTP